MRVLNKYRDPIPAGAVNIMRPSKWGNPYKMSNKLSRKAVVFKHRLWVLNSSELLLKIREELAGKDLVCCCKPRECHGDIYLHLANCPEKEFKEILKDAQYRGKSE